MHEKRRRLRELDGAHAACAVDHHGVHRADGAPADGGLRQVAVADVHARAVGAGVAAEADAAAREVEVQRAVGVQLQLAVVGKLDGTHHCRGRRGAVDAGVLTAEVGAHEALAGGDGERAIGLGGDHGFDAAVVALQAQALGIALLRGQRGAVVALAVRGLGRGDGLGCVRRARPFLGRNGLPNGQSRDGLVLE